MSNIDLLSLKKKEFIDNEIKFLSNQYIKSNIDIPIIATAYMDAKHLCRLDGIYMEQYGTMDFYDLFLKFNHIDDPLGIPIGYQILFPDLFALKSIYELRELKGIPLNKEKVFIGRGVILDGTENETAMRTRSIMKTRGTGVKVDSANGRLIF